MNANVSPMTLVVLLIWALSSLPAIAQTAERSRAQMIEHGKYLVLLGHCNNCHTAGYVAAAGKVPEERWLMGNPIGWRGKNGTTKGDFITYSVGVPLKNMLRPAEAGGRPPVE